MTRAARPRTSSAGSGFFLFGIMLLPVENASEARTKPNDGFDHQVSSSASRLQVDHPEGDRAQRLDDEVAVRDRVEGVRADAIEVELTGGGLAVERVAGAGQGTRPERADVRPPPSVGQAVAVALDHLDVRQEVMGEQDRLGALQVGVPGMIARPRARPARRAPARRRGRQRPGGRSPGASRAAGPSRPGRCATGRCGACPRPVRSAPPARPRG